MKKIILTLGLAITAAVLTSYVEPTNNEVKFDKNSGTMEIRGGIDNSGTR